MSCIWVVFVLWDERTLISVEDCDERRSAQIDQRSHAARVVAHAPVARTRECAKHARRVSKIVQCGESSC